MKASPHPRFPVCGFAIAAHASSGAHYLNRLVSMTRLPFPGFLAVKSAEPDNRLTAVSTKAGEIESQTLSLVASTTGRSNFNLLLRAAVLCLVAVTLAIYTLGPLNRARWAIQDDHEIAFFSGPGGRLPFSGIPRMLRETDIGYAGRISRFRPAYMGLRLLESSLWGLSPAGWYRTRLVLYAMSVFLVGWVLAARVGTIASVGLVGWVLSARYWFQVWGRLGPPESYAAFGCALWGSGIYLLWPSGTASTQTSSYRQWLGLLLFVLGNLLVVGAKENFLILAAPNVVLAISETRFGRTGEARWWACLTNVAAAIAVATPLAIYFAAVPVDYYGHSVMLPQRVAVLARGAVQFTALHAAFILGLVLWVGTRTLAFLAVLSPSSAWRRLTSGLVFASASALALFLSQFVLYNGDITRDTHYEFPAALAEPGLVVGVSLCLRDFFLRTGLLRVERAIHNLTATALLGLALLHLHGFHEQREMSRGWAAATTDFTAGITSAAKAARSAPNVPVVIISGRPLDDEPIVAVDRFLLSLGASNARFLVLDWEPGRQQWSPLENYLAPGIERLAREGGLRFRPASQLDPAAPCFSIGLSHEPQQGCRSLGRLW